MTTFTKLSVMDFADVETAVNDAVEMTAVAVFLVENMEFPKLGILTLTQQEKNLLYFAVHQAAAFTGLIQNELDDCLAKFNTSEVANETA